MLVWIQITPNNHGGLSLAGLVHCARTLTAKVLQLFMVINMFLKIVGCELRLKSAIWKRQPRASSGVALSAATAQISSTGRVELISGGSVVKTYTAIVKKSVTWPADLNATRVVSGALRTCALMSNNVWCWGIRLKWERWEMVCRKIRLMFQ